MQQAQRGEREFDDATGEDAVIMRCGKVGEWARPVGYNPETLGEEDQQKKRGEALRTPDVDAGKVHSTGVDLLSSIRCNEAKAVLSSTSVTR